MAMNKDQAARIIARAQVGRSVESAELNTALAVHGLTRGQFDALKAELRSIKGNRRSPLMEPVGDFSGGLSALCA